MARPVAADAEATRARILAAAVQLVSSRGIEGTTVRDVAAGAGVSLATVLHYFGSKEGLYGACVQAMDDELAALRAELLAVAVPGVVPSRSAWRAQARSRAKASGNHAAREGEELIPDPEGRSSSGSGVTRAELLSRMVRRAWAFACAHRVAHRIILRMVLDHGGLPKDRLDTLLRPSLDDAESVLAPLLDVSPLRARLSMQTLVQLVARYAICGDDELRLITGANDVAAAERVIGDHLVDLAAGLLLSPATRDAPAFPAHDEASA